MHARASAAAFAVRGAVGRTQTLRDRDVGRLIAGSGWVSLTMTPNSLPMDSRLERALTAALVALLAGCAAVEEPSPGYRPLSAAEGRALVGRLLPDGVKDRAGWATDIYAAFAALDIAPTPENICAAIAVTAQESGFQVDPAVPGLAGIARKEIDKRRESAGIPKFALDAALALSLDQRQELRERLDAVKTELQLSEIYEDFIGRVPFGKRCSPIAIRCAPAARCRSASRSPRPSRRRSRILIRSPGTIRHEVFTRRGGMYFGIAHLLDYPAPYTRMLYRFADFNAGQYASRNAAFQNAVTQVSGIPLELDGDLLRYDRGEPAPRARQHRARHPRAGAAASTSSNEDIRRDLELGKAQRFEQTRLYARVFALADTPAGKPAPRAVLPQIPLHSPKITRNLTTDWFANRVEGRYQSVPAAPSRLKPGRRVRSGLHGVDRGRYRSAVLERRLALLDERAHAFLLVVERERRSGIRGART